MKKIISFTLALLMLLSLCACSTGNPAQTSGSTESKQTSVVSSPEASSSTPSPQEPAKQMLAVDPTRFSFDHGGYETLKGITDEYYHTHLFTLSPTPSENGCYKYSYGADGSLEIPETVTPPVKEKFTVKTAENESKTYSYCYFADDCYPALGETHFYRLLDDTIRGNYNSTDPDYLEYLSGTKSCIEIWKRGGALRSMTLFMDEVPEARITGDITVESVLNKAEELFKLYDESFSLAELVTTPTEIKPITLKSGEIAGYRITCYNGDADYADEYACFFTVHYDPIEGSIYIYADKDVAEECVDSRDLKGGYTADNEELSKVYDLLTEEVIAESVNAFLEKNLTDPAYAERWSKPALFMLAHKNGYTIVELIVYYYNPEDEWCTRNGIMVLTYEIPDGTALLKDVS